jgi:hypothetical protein
VAKIVRNTAGQISIQTPEGNSFDMSKHIGAVFYTTPPAAPVQEPVGQLQEEAYGRGQVMWFNKPADQSMLYTTPQQEILLEPEGRCKECLTYNGHHDGCSQATPQPQQTEKQDVPETNFGNMEKPVQEPVGRFAKFTDGIWREVTDGSAGVPLYTTAQSEFGDTAAAYMVGVQDGKKAEREACAKMVEELNEIGHSYGLENRIRARSNT